MNHSTQPQQIRVCAFVEGPGDRLALPFLLEKYKQDRERRGLHINIVIGDIEPKGGTLDDNACKRLLRKIERTLDDSTVLLILRDAFHPKDPKRECALVTTNKLARWVKKEGLKAKKVPVGVVVAKWEYEAWLIASIGTMGGMREGNLSYLRPNARCKQDPEEVDDPKAWIERHAMIRTNSRKHPKYKETKHQPEMTQCLDFDKASHCPSFKRLLQALDEIIEMVANPKEHNVTPQLNAEQFPCCH